MSTRHLTRAMATAEQPTKRQRTVSTDLLKAIPVHDVDLSTFEVRQESKLGMQREERTAFTPLIAGSCPKLLLTPDGDWLTAPFKMSFSKLYGSETVSDNIVELTLNLTPELCELWAMIDGRFAEEFAKRIPDAEWKSTLYKPAGSKYAPNLKLRINLTGFSATALAVKRPDGTVKTGSGIDFFKAYCGDLHRFSAYVEGALKSVYFIDGNSRKAGLSRPVCQRVIFRELESEKPSSAICWDDDELRYTLSQ
jgi:hypothetical protein